MKLLGLTIIIFLTWLVLNCNIQVDNIAVDKQLVNMNSDLKVKKVICTDLNEIVCCTEYSDRSDFRSAQTVLKILEESSEIKVKVPGVFCEAYYVEGVLYFITQNYNSKQNPKNSFHKLYKLSLASKDYQEIFRWDIENSYIHSMMFDTQETGFIFFRPSGNPLDYQILKTYYGGENWETIDFKKPIISTKSMMDNLYILSYKKNNKTDWMFSVNKKNGLIDSLQFALNITDFSVGENGDYWLLGKDGDRTVLQHYEDGHIKELMSFSADVDYYPKKLYKYKNTIVAVTSWIDKSLLGGFGGTKAELYLSKDNGLTWNIKRLDEKLNVKSISFYKDERMTAWIHQREMISINLK